jgi:hypothetical protein
LNARAPHRSARSSTPTIWRQAPLIAATIELAATSANAWRASRLPVRLLTDFRSVFVAARPILAIRMILPPRLEALRNALQ